jgi:hypothetical protein
VVLKTSESSADRAGGGSHIAERLRKRFTSENDAARLLLTHMDAWQGGIVAQAGRSGKGQASGFLSLPSTTAGKRSARLLLLSLVLMMLNALVVLPATERRAGLELVRSVFTGIVVLSLASAGIGGLIALVRDRDRSWPVIVAVLLSISVIGLEVVGIFIPQG